MCANPMHSSSMLGLLLLSIHFVPGLGWSPLFCSSAARFRHSPCNTHSARSASMQNVQEVIESTESRSNFPSIILAPTIEIRRPKIRYTVPSTKPGWQDTNGQWYDEVCVSMRERKRLSNPCAESTAEVIAEIINHYVACPEHPKSTSENN